MNILGFDTTMGACSVAVLAGDETVFALFERRTRGHAEALMPMINCLMDEAGLGFQDLDRIAVTRGPGSFTGVRTGVAAARGLALASGVPLVGFSTLELLAEMALDRLKDREGSLMLVSIATGRNLLYLQLFTPEGKALSAPQLQTLEGAFDLLMAQSEKKCVVVGSGGDMFTQSPASQPLEIAVENLSLEPDAKRLVAMAGTRSLSTSPVSPLYLRPPDARPQSHKTLPRVL